MRYVVRLGLIERCYVERDYIVDANSPMEAEEFALIGENVVDAGPDQCCIPDSVEDRKIVDRAQPAE
jgi:hypothetical protein